jgi:hypothetical protein
MLRVAHFIVILCVTVLSDVMLRVNVLSVEMQRVVMLSVICWCHYAVSHHVAFILQIVFTFFTKQVRLMRVLTVMNLPPSVSVACRKYLADSHSGDCHLANCDSNHVIVALPKRKTGKIGQIPWTNFHYN